MQLNIKNNSLKIAYILFITIALIFIGSFVHLSFYNHPSTDDYILGYNLRELGFIQYQQKIYFHWGGRYFTNILGATFGLNQFLFNHYYFHTIILVVLFFISVWFFIYSITNCWLKNFFSNSTIIAASIFCCIGLITCLPEISTAFFWFSSSITYVSSAILLMAFFGILIRLLRVEKNKKIHLWVLFWILIIMLCGTNEVAALCTGFILLIFAILVKKTVRLFNILMGITALVYLASLLFSALAPGNNERLTLFSEKSIVIILGSSIVRVAYTFFTIFQSPLFYVAAIGMLLFGIQYGGNTFVKKRGKSIFINLSICTLIIAISLFIIHLPILYHSNGSLPERATNLFVIITFIALLMSFFYSGTQINNQSLVLITIKPNTSALLLLIMSISIVCNNTTKEIIKSVLSAKLYDSILDEREQILMANKRKDISVISYDSAVTKHYNKLYGNNQKEVIKKIILQKPNILFFEDDFISEKNISEIKRYYQLESLKVVPKYCN